MHQCTYGCGPEYLKELLTRKTVTRSLRTNTDDQNNFVIPFNKHKTFGDTSSVIAAHVSGKAYQMKSKEYNSTPASNKDAKLSFSENTSEMFYNYLLYICVYL